MKASQAIGKSKGHFTRKENRAQKLIDQWSALEKKMRALITYGGGYTHRARCAWGILFMMKTGIRIGNEGSAEGYICENKFLPEYGQVVRTYGLTTLMQKHVQTARGYLCVDFVGKKHVAQNLCVDDEQLRSVFLDVLRYDSEGTPKKKTDLLLGITQYELTKFVKRYVGKGFSPKDIRTATVNLAFIREMERSDIRRAAAQAETKRSKKGVIALAVERTAEKIGHTKAVCRSAYISPHLLAYYGKELGV